MDKMIGKLFGSWEVKKYNPLKKPGRYYDCQCVCGNIATIPTNTLNAGRSTKCKDCMYQKLHEPKEIVGRRFGKWMVKTWEGNRTNNKGTKGYHIYDCVCDCGSTLIINGSDLKSGRTSQCNNCARSGNLKYAVEKNTRHGMHNSKIYKIWSSMKYRCLNPKAPFYNRYGGRGIKVCERWIVFDNFFDDMGEKPDGLELDRIDNNGDYEPENCRWITHKENCNNRYY
tara:strand:- start:227 stop:907 length:681 start_codon:yes stop_codon:yes gene_type:complete